MRYNVATIILFIVTLLFFISYVRSVKAFDEVDQIEREYEDSVHERIYDAIQEQFDYDAYLEQDHFDAYLEGIEDEE